MTEIKTEVYTSDLSDEDKKGLEKILGTLSEMKKVFVEDEKDFDEKILDRIEILHNPAEVDYRIMNKYIDSLDQASSDSIEAGYRQFIEEHNNVLFSSILPQLELLNELYKLIAVRERKLGESADIQIIGRINEIVRRTKPILGQWLDVQKDLQAKLKHDTGLSVKTGDKWQASHVDAFGKSSGHKKVALPSGFPPEQSGGAKRKTKRKAKKKSAKRKAPKRKATKRKAAKRKAKKR